MKWTSTKAKKTLIVLLLIATGISLSGCAFNEHLIAGQQYVAAGDWDKSVQSFQEALKEHPEDPAIRLLLLRSKRNACIAHLAKGEFLLDKGRFEEAITEFRMGIAFDPTNLDAESLLKKAEAMRESEYNFKKGQNLEKTQNFSQAKEAYQKALELNPENSAAYDALARYKKKDTKPPPKYPLKIQNERPISLKFKNTPILNVFEVLTRLTGVNFIFDKDVKETKVTFFLSNVSFDQFIEIFLRTNQLAASMVNEKTMIIYPDTPQKAKEYQDLQIRTFYLAHLDVKKTVALLTKILKTKDISANEDLNAVVIRGTKEAIEVAAKLIEANDRPSSEVTLNVEILEVNRTKEKQLGFELSPTSVTFGLGGPTSDFYTPGTAPPSGGASLKTLDRISNANILVSIPSATLNLLKRDGDTKVLAQPQIRVKNGEKAKIHIGERVPLLTNRRWEADGSAITYDYEYQEVGVKLNVAPVINLYDEVTLKLTLEISSIGENVGTIDDPKYSIKARTAESVMSVRAGESIIIGGLISDEERQTVRKVPFLGEIPVLGYLFSSLDTDKIQTDILMAITPIVVRGQEIPDPGIARIWSGKEQDFSLKGPYEGVHDLKEDLLDHPREDINLEQETPPVTGPVEGPPPGPAGPPEDLPPDDIPPKQMVPKEEPELPPPPEDMPPPPPRTGMSKPAETAPPGPRMTDKPALPDHTTSPPVKSASQEAVRSGMSSSDFFPYTIQVNAYVRELDAERRVEKLTRMKYDCFTHSVYVPGKDKTYYRVFIGKFENYQSAAEACRALKQLETFQKDIYVVKRNWAMGG